MVPAEGMTDIEIYVAVATIAVFGIGGQWISRRMGFPSLLLLLPLGLLAGDVLGLVQPELLLGDLLFPGVELLVALLLFQSGLQLRFAELPRAARSPVIRLLTVGLAVTFLGASGAALIILDIDAGLAFVLGAILVVSGPTVVGPLLASVRPRPPIGSVLNYEGTFLDPIGATLGVVVLTAVVAEGTGGLDAVVFFLSRLGLGIAIGLAATAGLVLLMSRFWVTYKLEAAVAVMFAVGAFVLAEALVPDSGLFAALTLGVALANQRLVSVGPTRVFGETLEVLIIASLFITLGALVTIDGLVAHASQIALLVAVLVIIVRPATVLISLLGTRMDWRDQALIGSVDPRGIVAASTAAAFTGTLAAAGFDSDFLLPMVFGVILGTGIIYGLGAKPVAAALGVIRPTPRGVALIGRSDWIIELGRRLREVGVSVMVVNASSPEQAKASQDATGVPTLSLADSRANISEVGQEIDVGQAAICGPADIALSLLDFYLIEVMGRRKVLRLPDEQQTNELGQPVVSDRSAHPFEPGVTVQGIEARVAAGASVELLTGPPATTDLVLAVVSPDGVVDLQPDGHGGSPQDHTIALVGGQTRGGDPTVR